MIRGRSPVTVGRSDELAVIDRALAGARDGRGSTLVLVGEAGSGKTRLMREAIERAGTKGFAILAGDAPATATPAPFGVLAGALRGWLRERPAPVAELAPFAAGLRRIVPEWPAPPDAPGAEQTRLLALEAAVRLVTAAARPSGALLALDDLHAADPETVEFLHHVSGSIARAPVVVLAATRSGEDAPAEVEARALAQRGRADLVEVRALGEHDVETMIGAILDAAPPAALVAEVTTRADGIPLLVEELIAAYADAGSLHARDGELSWSPSGRMVPRTIMEMTRQRMRALAPDARAAVEAVAVARRADLALLAAMTESDQRTIASALDRASAAGLLEGTQGFRHALLAEAAYDAIAPDQRASMHRLAARAIRELHGDDPARLEERARHHEAVEEPDAAAALLVAAARHGLVSHAAPSAEALARRARALARSTATRVEASDALTAALSALGRRDEALRIDAEQPEPGPPERLVRMAGNALRMGRLDEADALIERAAGAGASPGPLRAIAALGSLWRGDFETAIARASEALDDPDPQVVCDALDVYGRAHDMRGDRAEATGAFERWIAVAGEAGLTASKLQGLMELGNVEFMTTYVPGRLRETRALARDAGAYQTMVLADLSLVWCLGATGDLREALAIGEEALDFARRFEMDLLPHVMEALAWARGRQRHGSGDALLAETLALAPDDVDILVQAYDAYADWQIRAGRFADAVQNLERSIEIMLANPSAVPLVAPAKHAIALMALGRDDEAREALRRATGFTEKPRLLVVPLWVDAAAAIHVRSPDDVDAALPADTTVPYERATLLSLAAQIVPTPRQADWLRDALSIFEAAGAEDDAARVRRLMRTAGVPVPRARRTTAAVAETLRARGVTRREADVLELVGAGLTNGEIAEKLFLSVRTVESHVSSLLTKLQADSRAALIAAALGR